MVRRRIALILAALVPIALIAGLIFIVSTILPKAAPEVAPTSLPSKTAAPANSASATPTTLLVLPPTYTPTPTDTPEPTRTITPTKTAIPPSPTPTKTKTAVKLPCVDLTGSWTGLEWVVDGSSRLPTQYEFVFTQDVCSVTGKVTIFHQDQNDSKETADVSAEVISYAYYFTLKFVDVAKNIATYKTFILFALDQNNLYSGKDTGLTPGYIFRMRKNP
jgi:hypothetical protein